MKERSSNSTIFKQSMNCLKPGVLPRLVRGSSISRVTNTCSFHIKKKIVRTEDEEREEEKRRSKTKNLHSSNNKHYSNSSNNHHNHHNKHHQNKMVHQRASLMLNSHPQKFRYGSCYSFVGIKGKERNHQTCCVGEIAQEKGTRQGIYQFDRRSVSAIFRYFNQ